MVGFGGVHRSVVVLWWSSGRCVVFWWAIHCSKVFAVILRYGDRALLPQDVCKCPGKPQNYTNVKIVIYLCFSSVLNDSLLLGRYCDFMGDSVLVIIIIVSGIWLIGLSMFFRPHQVHMEGWSPWVGWEGESSKYNEKSSKGVCFLLLALLLEDRNRLLLQYCLISRLLHYIKDIKLLNFSPTPHLPSIPTMYCARTHRCQTTCWYCSNVNTIYYLQS